jgi:hypothetical protein
LFDESQDKDIAGKIKKILVIPGKAVLEKNPAGIVKNAEEVYR